MTAAILRIAPQNDCFLGGAMELVGVGPGLRCPPNRGAACSGCGVSKAASDLVRLDRQAHLRERAHQVLDLLF